MGYVAAAQVDHLQPAPRLRPAPRQLALQRQAAEGLVVPRLRQAHHGVIAAKGQPVEFGKNNNNEWTILKPKPLRADGSSVDTLVSKLKDAKMDLTTEPAEAAKKFAASAKVATATGTDGPGTRLTRT